MTLDDLRRFGKLIHAYREAATLYRIGGLSVEANEKEVIAGELGLAVGIVQAKTESTFPLTEFLQTTRTEKYDTAFDEFAAKAYPPRNKNKGRGKKASKKNV